MQKIKNINDLIKSFKNEKKLALIVNGKKISYKHLYKDIIIVSSQILKNSKGQKINVGIYTDDPYENILGFFGAIYAGSISVPISNISYLKKNFINNFKIELLLIGKNVNKNIILKIKIPKIKLSFEPYKNQKFNFNNKKTHIQDTAAIMLTSGTTGLKKGVILSHNNLIKTSKYINKFMLIKKKIVEYLMVPLTNSFGFGRLRCVLLKKGCLIIDSGFFNPLLMIRRFEEYDINCISGVPSAFAMLISLPLKRLKKVREKLIWAEIGSAPMKKVHKTKLLNLFPNRKIVMHYGLTEASRSTLLELKRNNKKNELIGKPVPGVKISICDEFRKVSKKKNFLGEIVIEGQNVAKGYCNLTSNKFEKNKFYSGDLGLIDKNDNIYFYGRKDEIINVGGTKISPIFLENIINKKICLGFDFSIFSSPKKHKIHDNVVGIFLKEKIRLKHKLNKINKILINNGVPNEGIIRDVVYIKKFPKTPNGKIRRKFLKNHILNVESL